jgi:selenocysteine lyase/cysteine desulfurase
MSYFWLAGLAEHYCNNIKTIRAVLYIVGCKKIACGPEQSGFFDGRDDRLSRLETFIGSRFYLDKDDGAVTINHNQIDFAGLAGKVPRELFQAFASKVPFAAFFTPSAEHFRIGQ